MLLGFFLLFLWGSTVKSQTTKPPLSISTPPTNTSMEGKLPPVWLVATPDNPVAVGQTVNLYCSADTMPESVSWCWERFENQTWKFVSNGTDLSLTKPQESGLYRCSAKHQSSLAVSPNHTVYIVDILPTVAENLGIAAFVLSFISLIINLAILSWLGWQKLGATTSTTAPKDVPGPAKAPKGGFPRTEGDGDVYINYSNTNPAYSDLDPTSMTVDNVYSTLS